MPQLNRPALGVAGLTLLLVATGCSESASRALVPVDINPGTVAGIKTVEVTVTTATDEKLVAQAFDWTAAAGAPLKVGVYLPDGFSGDIAVRAEAHDGTGRHIGTSNRVTGAATKGERSSTITLTLAPDTSGGDGGAGTGGSMGTGGTGGTGGAGGGAGGTGGGTGGAGGGTGGVGGSTGGTGGSPGDGPEAGSDVPSNPDMPPVISATWMPGEDIEKDPLAASYTPDVAIDGAGNVLVAWREGNGVKFRRYNGTTRAWEASKTLEDRGTVDGVQVAIGGRHALVLWFLRTAEAPAGTRGIWLSYSSNAGVDWTPPMRVHDGPVYYDHLVAIAANGFARMAWQESFGNINSLWTAHYDPASGGLGGVAMVRMGSDSDERYPRLAIDAAGTGLLGWVQDDGMGHDSAWGVSFTGATLGTQQLLDNYTTDNAWGVDVSISATGGKGLAVWEQRDGSTSSDLFAADWVAGEGWKAPVRVPTPAWATAPAVVLDRAGNATVAFTQPITGYKWNVISLRRPAGGTWSAAQPLETTNQAPGRTDQDPYARLGVDGAGNVHAVWRRKTSASADVASVIVRRYGVAAAAWEPEVVLGEVPMLKAYHPELAVADDGRAAATFYFQDPAGTANLMSFNVFVSLYR